VEKETGLFTLTVPVVNGGPGWKVTTVEVEGWVIDGSKPVKVV
jgi:hypothetical protein